MKSFAIPVAIIILMSLVALADETDFYGKNVGELQTLNGAPFALTSDNESKFFVSHLGDGVIACFDIINQDDKKEIQSTDVDKLLTPMVIGTGITCNEFPE